MPIYEYKCKYCGKVQEVIVTQKKKKIVCKNCGNRKLKRLMSPSNFRMN